VAAGRGLHVRSEEIPLGSKDDRGFRRAPGHRACARKTQLDAQLGARGREFGLCESKMLDTSRRISGSRPASMTARCHLPRAGADSPANQIGARCPPAYLGALMTKQLHSKG